MARLNICGFETGNALESFAQGTTQSVQSTTKRTGGYAGRINPGAGGNGAFQFRGIAADGTSVNFNNATLYARVYFQVTALPASNDIELCNFQNTSSVIIGILYMTPAGRLKFKDNAGTTTTGSTFTIPTGSFFMAELKCNPVTAGTGVWEVKANGASEISSTTADLSNVNLGRFNVGNQKAVSPEATDYYVDDIAIDDAAYPGAGQVNILKPNGAGDNTGWASGTSSLYTAINEVPNDGDTSYIASAGSSISDFTHDSCATGGVAGTIAAVKLVSISKYTTAGSNLFSPYFKIAASFYENASFAAQTTAYAAYSLFKTVDPSTSAAWTTSGLDAAKIGVDVSNPARCTALYAMVENAGVSPANLVLSTIAGQSSLTAAVSTKAPLVLSTIAAQGAFTVNPLATSPHLAPSAIATQSAFTAILSAPATLVPSVIAAVSSILASVSSPALLALVAIAAQSGLTVVLTAPFTAPKPGPDPGSVEINGIALSGSAGMLLVPIGSAQVTKPDAGSASVASIPLPGSAAPTRPETGSASLSRP